MTAYSGDRWETARAAALERDEHTCQICGTERNIHAHHIIPAKDFDNEQDAHYQENLIALCGTCHPKVEGEPQWPVGRIETADGISHISNLLALDTVSRFATGEAAPELVRRHLLLNKYLCSVCLRRTDAYDPEEQNPFEDYHNALYRIVVRQRGLAESKAATIPKGFSFCNMCLGSLRYRPNGLSERENAAQRLVDLLEAFGFNRPYTGTFDYEQLTEVVSYNHAQSEVSKAFGRSREPITDTKHLQMAFRESVRDYHGEDPWGKANGLELPERFENYKDGGGIDIPDWYRAGLNDPNND